MLDDETQQPQNGESPVSQDDNIEDNPAKETVEEALVETPQGEIPSEGSGAPRRQRRRRTTGSDDGGVTVADTSAVPSLPPRLLEQYRSEIVPAMMREFGYANTMEVPRLQKKLSST